MKYSKQDLEAISEIIRIQEETERGVVIIKILVILVLITMIGCLIALCPIIKEGLLVW